MNLELSNLADTGRNVAACFVVSCAVAVLCVPAVTRGDHSGAEGEASTAWGWEDAERLPDDPGDADYLRTKTEWLTFRSGVGRGAVYAALSLFTLRWERFYWEVVRLSVVRSLYEIIDLRLIVGWAGTAIGVPVHVDELGRHEFRFGLGFGVGYGGHDVDDPCGEDYETDTSCIRNVFYVASADASYIWHVADHFALFVGILSVQFGWSAEGLEPSCCEGAKNAIKGTFPAVNFSIGFII